MSETNRKGVRIMKDNVLQVRLNDSLYQRVKELAEENDMPLSTMIRTLTKEAVDYRELGMSIRLAEIVLTNVQNQNLNQ